MKKHSISKKKNQSNRSPNEGDIADLKSVLFVEILVTAGELQRRSEIPSAWIKISTTWADAE